MGSYEREMERVAKGLCQRGDTALAYIDEWTAAQKLPHTGGHTDYSKTLFAPEHDDIYREFCRFYDQPEPRMFDTLEDQIEIEGYTARDIYFAMLSGSSRLHDLNGVAVYNMLVKLRVQPVIAKKIINYKPSCPKGVCSFDR